MVFEVYSSFVNNFSLAMKTVKKQARSKPVFADFLKVCGLLFWSELIVKLLPSFEQDIGFF
jgi:hypothetical protein